MQLTNIPRYADKCQLEVRVADNMTKIVVVDPTKRDNHKDDWWLCGSVYVGDHMFEPDKRDALREMIGRELIHAIHQARDAGYRQAQYDMRAALGLLR